MATKLNQFVFITVLFLSICFTACDDGGGSSSNPSTTPPSNSTPTAVITADDYITSGAVLDGSSSTDPDGTELTYAWSETTSTGVTFGTASDSTTTVSFSGWNNAAFQAAVKATVRLTVSDGTDEASDEQDIIIYRTDYAYVASGATGDGSAPNSALGTINAGIQYADTNGRSAVAVPAATYTVNHDENTHVQMTAGISLAGGYSSDFTTRDTSANETIIVDSSAEPANDWDALTCAVSFASSSITSATVLDGFTVLGHDTGILGMAVYIMEGSPTILNCNLVGGDGTNGSGILIRYYGSATVLNNTISGSENVNNNVRGIYIFQQMSGAGATIIQGNTINGQGLSSIEGNSCGIFLYEASDITIENNSITGGKCQLAYGIYIQSDCDNIEISDNILISGGSSTVNTIAIYTEQSTVISNNFITSGTGADSYAIDTRNSGMSPEITNNVIEINTSSTICRGIYILQSSPSIENNTIYSLSTAYGWGIYEYDDASDPATVTGNNIYDCPQGLYYDNETTLIVADQVDVSGYFTDGTNVVETGNTDYSGNESTHP